MGALDGQIWVCAECRSINNERAKQCYNCRTPRDLAAVDPSSIEGTGHGKLREIALPAFHPPRPYAAVATILILAIAGMQVVYTVDVAALAVQTLGGIDPTEEQLRFLGMVGLVTLAIGVLALIAWSAWLSRAVSAMPALGLGYPAASGLMAFVENFLPGLNLLRVPAIVRDVVRRVEPGQNRGEALIFAAWIGLLLGFVAPRIGAVLSGLSAETAEAALRSQLTIIVASTGFVLIGAIFLVALIWWIEARIGRRREAQLAAIDAATAGASDERVETTEEGVAVTYSTPRVNEKAQVPVGWSREEGANAPLAGSAQAMPAPSAPLGPGWDMRPVVAAAPLRPSVPASPVAAASSAHVESGPVPRAEGAPMIEPVAGLASLVEPPTAPEVQPTAASQPAAIEHVTPPEPAAIAGNGAPHLTIRVVSHGMLQAEMAGETEPLILDDLPAYGAALANAGGTAEIVIAAGDDMAPLIARRAQRIMADAGIEASLPD